MVVKKGFAFKYGLFNLAIICIFVTSEINEINNDDNKDVTVKAQYSR